LLYALQIYLNLYYNKILGLGMWGRRGGYRGVRWSKKKGVKSHKCFLKNKTQKMNELKLKLNINNKIYALCMKKTS